MSLWWKLFTKAHGRPNGYRKVLEGRATSVLYLGISDDRQDVGTTAKVFWIEASSSLEELNVAGGGFKLSGYISGTPDSFFMEGLSICLIGTLCLLSLGMLLDVSGSGSKSAGDFSTIKEGWKSESPKIGVGTNRLLTDHMKFKISLLNLMTMSDVDEDDLSLKLRITPSKMHLELMIGCISSPVPSNYLTGIPFKNIAHTISEDFVANCPEYKGNVRYDYLANKERKNWRYDIDNISIDPGKEECFFSSSKTLSSDVNDCGGFKENSSDFQEHDLYDPFSPMELSTDFQDHNLKDAFSPNSFNIFTDCINTWGEDGITNCSTSRHHASSIGFDCDSCTRVHPRNLSKKCFSQIPLGRRGRKKQFSSSTLQRQEGSFLALSDSLTMTTGEGSNNMKQILPSEFWIKTMQLHAAITLTCVFILIFHCRPDVRIMKSDKGKGNNKCNIDSFEEFIPKEIQDPLDSGEKWQNSHPHLTSGSRLLHPKNQDAILDIASGILHLAGDSLIPRSLDKNCLESAKVLQQVDKKFIPIVASRTLALIDQLCNFGIFYSTLQMRGFVLKEPATEGIGVIFELFNVTFSLTYKQNPIGPIWRTEENKLYLDSEQGLVGQCLKLAFNCYMIMLNKFKIGVGSAMFIVRVQDLLQGVNLSDVDLLEFLQQLADTDGSSTVPPSVHRVLNNKACRGAIMFGDALLPSECSLIVEELKQTSLCFQCAHGRPTTVPLVNLDALSEQIAKITSWSSSSWSLFTRICERSEMFYLENDKKLLFSMNDQRQAPVTSNRGHTFIQDRFQDLAGRNKATPWRRRFGASFHSTVEHPNIARWIIRIRSVDGLYTRKASITLASGDAENKGSWKQKFSIELKSSSNLSNKLLSDWEFSAISVSLFAIPSSTSRAAMSAVSFASSVSIVGMWPSNKAMWLNSLSLREKTGSARAFPFGYSAIADLRGRNLLCDLLREQPGNGQEKIAGRPDLNSEHFSGFANASGVLNWFPSVRRLSGGEKRNAVDDNLVDGGGDLG
nr:DNA mismatch repair protein MLH3-like isoform X1 [Ipomoea batatas]